MKKIILYSIILMWGLMACQNQEQIFDDFGYKAVYFPHQLPLRTLSLGEDRVDNTLDKAFQFDIGVTIGGMYENKWNWTVDYVVDNTLADSIYISLTGEKVHALPSAYYTLSPENTVTIPAGFYNGRIRVQLTDAFFNDTLSLMGTYVVPLRITGTTADTILSGKATTTDPDLRDAADWEAGKSPKNWVMYGIKYINAYQGTYFQRGRDILYSGIIPVDTVIYKTAHVEWDRLVSIISAGKTKSIANFLSLASGSEGTMLLEFANMWGTPGGNITITPLTGAQYAVSGSGQFIDKAASTEKVVGLNMQSMYLNYIYNDGTYTHHVSDTLVFRDRGMNFEENEIVIGKP